MPRVGLSKTFRFEAAHHLSNYEGKCACLHGHSYRLRVVVSGSVNHSDKAGIVLDFGTLSEAVDEVVLRKYDHKDLNAFFEHPTAENMVQVIWAELVNWFRSRSEMSHVEVEQVRLWETENCWAEYPFRII